MVSPGFTPRPSLSARRAVQRRLGHHVSPGFTPRPSLSVAVAARVAVDRAVSPGFTPRPSLSVPTSQADHAAMPQVSPGFTPRPSLSAPPRRRVGLVGARVAGVHAPAFVERPSWRRRSPGA